MPIDDYTGFTALINSRHAPIAVQELQSRAQRAGVGRSMATALAKLSPESGPLSTIVQEADLIEAFHHFEMLEQGGRHPGIGEITQYITWVSGLNRQLESIDDYEAILLTALDTNGDPVITDPEVRGHIDRIEEIVRRMGPRFLTDPEYWTPFIERASTDMTMMAASIWCTMPREGESVFSGFHRLVMRISELIWAVRADATFGGGETAQKLERMGLDINRALDDGAYHDVIQLSLKTWITSVELFKPYEPFAATPAPEAKVLAFPVASSRVAEIPMTAPLASVISLFGVRPLR